MRTLLPALAAALVALALPAPAQAQGVPTAAAGQDVYTYVGPLIVLNGSASSDPDGEPLSYAWAQVDGPAVELFDPDTAYPSFAGDEPGTFVFSLVVNDASQNASAADEVEVHLFPDPEHDLDAGCGCGSGVPAEASRTASAPAWALLALAAARRRPPR